MRVYKIGLLRKEGHTTTDKITKNNRIRVLRHRRPKTLTIAPRYRRTRANYIIIFCIIITDYKYVSNNIYEDIKKIL